MVFYLAVVVVCMKRQGRAGAGIGAKDFDALLHRLQRVVQAHPTATYDGKEVRGGEVRLYFFSDSASRLAKALALALSDIGWCRGAAVRVCSDTGARLEEFAVPLLPNPLPGRALPSGTRQVDLR